ncbi:hypothetical protein CC80DRAFT_228582 [Byssothecium circinans]|uniref:Uncharacterized protein n=1 Tax=Byssothecium circinans TaxID=147558 RepID=A0A6A5TFV2_9PLEO|nr:hypothetical protein CC80DRAFT_228582 [Byssothecium circinans]
MRGILRLGSGSGCIKSPFFEFGFWSLSLHGLAVWGVDLCFLSGFPMRNIYYGAYASLALLFFGTMRRGKGRVE